MQTTKEAIPNKPIQYAFMFCKSPSTKKQYPRRLKMFFDGIGLVGEDMEEQAKVFLEKAQENRLWATQQIMLYLNEQKQRVIAPKNKKEKISAGTLRTFWTPIKHFCDAYMEILPLINWRRISNSLPTPKTSSSDRVPTIEEVRKLVEYPDRRIKAIIYTMVSSGIRIGAWDYLKWKHVIPKTNAEYLRWKKQQEEREKGYSNIIITKEDEQKIVAASLVVYDGEEERYTTFITPEAYNALKTYMDLRAMWGEKITGESWLMRDYFRTSDVKRKPDKHGKMRGGATGVPSRPKPLRSRAMSRILLRALYEQGLRESLDEEEGTRRYEFKTAHSYRKYFKTRAEQLMNSLNVECLMSHKVGLNPNYYRPTDQALLADYLKVVPLLTINEYSNVEQLKEQQQILEHKGQKQEEEIEKLKQKYTESSHIMFQYFINEIESVKEKYEAKFAEMTQAPQRINKVQEGIDDRLREQEQQQQELQKQQEKT